jgi:type I restriction enzyme S subunit
MSNKAAVKQDVEHGLTPKLRFPEFVDAPGWKMDHLGQAAEFVSERIQLEKIKLENYVSTENILPDFGGVVKASNLPTTGSVTRFRINDVLISNIRPYLKKVWRSDKDGGSSNDVIVLRARQDLLEQFLPFILRNDAFIDYVMKGAKGVKMPRGDVSLMRQYPIGCPSPAEQQKIAECLTSLDEVIAAQRQKLDALKTHKKGLMQQLFPREGETHPRLRFPEFQDAPEWDERQLSELSTKISDGIHTTPVYEENGEYAFINGNNLVNGGIVINEKTKKVNSREFNKYKKPLDANSILISINGTIGNLAFYRGEHVVLGKSACFINIDGNLLNKVFIYNLLQTNKVQCVFNTEITGSTIKNLSLGTIKNLQLLVPTLPEQQKIADCLTSLDDLITAQSDKLSALKTHKKGLMQQLFPNLAKE